MPLSVSANVSLQYQVNSLGADWIVELVNNEGIVKPKNAAAIVDLSKTSKVEVTARFAYDKVILWGDVRDEQISGPGSVGSCVTLIFRPGDIAHVPFMRNLSMNAN